MSRRDEGVGQRGSHRSADRRFGQHELVVGLCLLLYVEDVGGTDGQVDLGAAFSVNIDAVLAFNMSGVTTTVLTAEGDLHRLTSLHLGLIGPVQVVLDGVETGFQFRLSCQEVFEFINQFHTFLRFFGTGTGVTGTGTGRTGTGRTGTGGTGARSSDISPTSIVFPSFLTVA